MHACETCGEEYETLSQLRLRHEPCPVAEAQREQEQARERLRTERGLEIGDLCRVVTTGKEVEIVDVEPEESGEPTVVWIPAGSKDQPDRRRRNRADELV